MKKTISIVIPVYNEEKIINIFFNTLIQELKSLEHDYCFEFIFTNNASKDASLSTLLSLRKRDSRVKLISYSRNFGYQASILGGITHAKGDAIVVIDVDGEDPASLIPKFIAKWEEGFQVVFGERQKRYEPQYITKLRLLFYRVLRLLADSEIILDMAEFSLFSKEVKESIIKSNNTFPFIRAEIAYSGYRKYGIKYDRQPRLGGRSNYNILGMLYFAISGILTVSTFPLRLCGYLGVTLLLLNIVAFPLIYISSNSQLNTLALLWINSNFLVAVALLLAVYIARIYKNGISRPVYIIDWDNSYL